MISINNSKNVFVLDLNESPFEEHELSIVSQDEFGRNASWGIQRITSNKIKATEFGGNRISINIDIENLNTDEEIVLLNINNEIFVIKIMHNLILSQEKEYKFKVTKKEPNGRTVKIRILSKENDREIGWRCTYRGNPINYDINPSKSDESGYVEITLLDEIYNPLSTIIEFTQNKSNKVIKLYLHQDNENLTIEKLVNP